MPVIDPPFPTYNGMPPGWFPDKESYTRAITGTEFRKPDMYEGLVSYEDAARQHKWDLRFLKMARDVSEWSKDPSTKCGCILTRGIDFVSLGFNGLPPKIADKPERLNVRETKIKIILHAEENANAQAKCDLTGCTSYTWPFHPCSKCASLLIRWGIVRVVYPKNDDTGLKERWGSSLVHEILSEAGVEQVEIDMEKEENDLRL